MEYPYGGPGVPTDKLLSPYDDITNDQWADDVSQWSPVEFGHLYLYVVETPEGYTREALMMAYKNLAAYNYYYRLDQS